MTFLRSVEEKWEAVELVIKFVVTNDYSNLDMLKEFIEQVHYEGYEN
jgi:hypothetical protein